MKCRNIYCSAVPVAYVRVQYTYQDSINRGQTALDIDADYLYCREHYERHKSDTSSFEFHDTLEGVRA